MTPPASALRRLARWLAQNDPGAVERWRALHFGLALTITVVAARATDAYLGLGMPLLFPMFAGLAAGIALFLLSPSRPRTELVDMLRLAGIVVGYVLIIAAADPAALPGGEVLLKLFLVPLIFAALYVRRYGPTGQQAGAAVIVTALMVSTADPDRGQALVLACGAVEGAIVAIVLRLVLRRRSALPGMSAAIGAYRAETAATLSRIGDALAAGVPPDPALLEPLEGSLRAVRAAATAALREAPGQRDVIDAGKALTYRTAVALALVREQLADLGEDRDALAPGGLLDAVRATERWVRAPAAARPGEAAHARAALTAARRHVLALRGSAGAGRDNALLAVAGLDRVTGADAELCALAAGTAVPVHGRPPASAPRAAHRGLRPTTRVAVQGLVAAAITTALDLGFSLDHAYWATLTVAFVLGGSFGETVGKIRGRLLGTVVGVGAGIVAIGPLHDSLFVVAGLCIVAEMLAIVTLRARPALSAGAIAFAVVLGLHLITGLGIAGMLARVYETAIGGAAAFLAARFVLPVYLADPTRTAVMALMARWRATLAGTWPSHDGARGEPATRIAADSAALLETLPTLNAESVLGRRASGDLVRLGTFVDVVASYMTMIDTAAARLAAVGTTDAARSLCTTRRDATLATFDAILAGVAPPIPEELAPSPAAPRERDPRAIQYLVEYLFLIEALTRTLELISETMRPTAESAGITTRLSRPARALGLLLALAVAAFGAAGGEARAERATPLTGWDWIIGGKGLPRVPPKVAYLGLDAIQAPEAFIAAANRNGTKTWCYISVGSIEEWQPDVAAFEALDARERRAGRPGIIGKDYDGWPGERWLNVSRYRLFLPLLAARMDRCRDKGFAMVEFDNLDGYQQKTGFRITRDQQIAFAKALARTARQRDLVPMQKNAPELIAVLEPHFGALLFEDCVLWDFCADARRYVAAGKPVFNAEYPEAWRAEGRTFERAAACATAARADVDLIVKKLSLGPWVRHCD